MTLETCINALPRKNIILLNEVETTYFRTFNTTKNIKSQEDLKMKEIKNNVEFEELDDIKDEKTKEETEMEEKKENFVVKAVKKATENKVVRTVVKVTSYAVAVAAGAAFILIFGSNNKNTNEIEYTEDTEEYTEE